VDGNLNAFTNPAIEAGLVHCRALLEFLGLCISGGRLGNIKKRRDSDVGIEAFQNAAGHLTMVAPDDVLSLYAGNREEAENAFACRFSLTNKSLAHFTKDLN